MEPWISELLPDPGDARDDDEHPERDVDVDVLQVVRLCAANFELAGGFADPPP